MSLITCCPNCRTMFKVVADQLKVSDGWVRCGHCDGVFDASAHFQTMAEPERLAHPENDDLDTPAAAPEFLADEEVAALTAPLTEPMTPALPDAPVDEFAKVMQAPFIPPARPQAPVAPQFVAHSELDDASVSAPLSNYLSAPEAADFPSQNDHARSQDGADRRALYGSTKSSNPAHSVKADIVRRPPLSEVTFVQAAQRKDKAKRPVYKLLAVLASMALLAALALQVLLHERDALAARHPVLLPALQGLCQTMACQINPPRVIEAVTIDSSSFTQTGPEVYRLNVVLKNSRAAVVAMPALEVTLTDAQNDVLIRKVLLPSEFGATSNRLEQATPFAGVFNLQLNLPPVTGAPLPAASVVDAASPDGPAAVDSPPAPATVTGYRLFAFYP